MLLRDFTYAARTLAKSPVFAATAIVTIALGIGASTAIFSVTNAVLLRPLPYKNPDRLFFAISDMRKRNVKDFPLSNANFLDIRNGTAGAFEELGAVNTGRATVPREDQSPEQIRWAAVTTNFFRLMGGQIALGRDFTDADGQPQPAQPAPVVGTPAPGQPRLPLIAILSYGYWQRRFGGNPSVVGRPMPGAIGGQGGTQIVGVLKPGFELLFPPDSNIEQHPDVWFAGRLAYDNANRNNVQWRAIGRLKDGVTPERAQSAMDRVAADLRKNFTIQQTSGFFIRLEPMHRHVVEEVRPALLALTGAVVFLLLIACANVANLLLVRASLRERELAIRTALGGSWWRLVSQTLAEALLLALTGALLGLGLAWVGIHELRAIAPASLPRLDGIGIDPTVLAFTALAALAAAGLFGLAPAVRAARPSVAVLLRASGRNAGLGGVGMLRNFVVVAEVALSFVLLIGSGLMFRSFLELQRIDPGFNPHGLLTFQLLGGRGGQKPEERAARQREIRTRLEALPGVDAATSSFPLPLAGGFSPIRWGLEPALTDSSKFQAVDFQIVLPGYFEVLHTPLMAGRTFTDADNAPDRKVVVIDQMLAAKAFPGQSAIGKRLLTRLNTPEPEWVEVIGVVAHQRNTSLAVAGREQIYFTDGFLGHGATGYWAIHTAGDPAKYAPAVRAAIAKLDPHLLITDTQPMDALVEHAQASTRFSLLLIGVFASVAALLAGVGLYGVLSTVVRQRTPEIGVRMALGAAPASILSLVVGQGLRLSAAGIAVGLVAAFELTRAMTSMLVGVRATDPATFVSMAVLFFAIAAVASWLPARRAAGLDPTAALREE
ncbi:MAG TPA: ABC transporter permease [Bryobacteraceae bacterium]|nr:ABC transporter permease [Bryobacteraceae bacterium]